MGIERFSIKYDLPANQAWRAIAAAGEKSYPLTTVDGAGGGAGASSCARKRTTAATCDDSNC